MMSARFFAPLARVAGNVFTRNYLTRRSLPNSLKFQQREELSEIISDKGTREEKIKELIGLSKTLEPGSTILVTKCFTGITEPRLLTATKVAEKAGILLARP